MKSAFLRSPQYAVVSVGNHPHSLYLQTLVEQLRKDFQDSSSNKMVVVWVVPLRVFITACYWDHDIVKFVDDLKMEMGKRFPSRAIMKATRIFDFAAWPESATKMIESEWGIKSLMVLHRYFHAKRKVKKRDEKRDTVTKETKIDPLVSCDKGTVEDEWRDFITYVFGRHLELSTGKADTRAV